MSKAKPMLNTGSVDFNLKAERPSNSKGHGAELLELASPRRRYLGQFIDVLITWAVFTLSLHIMNELSFPNDLTTIISIALASIYFVFSDALPKGQSLGKKLIKISVIDEPTGNYCSLSQSFLRNVFTPILGAIDAMFILSKSRQRLGDKLARTIVLKNS